MTIVTYTKETRPDKLLKICFAVGILSYKKVGHFWLDDSVEYSPRFSEILCKRIAPIIKAKPSEIHLAYYTGKLD